MTEKYLLKNTDTNVIDLIFDLPMNVSPPLEQIIVDGVQFRANMVKSIFIDVNNYKPFPGFDGNAIPSGEDWWVSDGTDWIDVRPDDKVWQRVRKVRNEALNLSDWTQLPDADLTGQQKGQWTAWRQQLRNVPNNNPTNPRAAEASLKTEINDNKPTTGRDNS
jgi:hypothetical protein